MNKLTIEDLVVAANQHEAETGALLLKLEEQLGVTAAVISLPDADPASALRAFVVEYIKQVPTFIEAVSFAAREAGIDA